MRACRNCFFWDRTQNNFQAGRCRRHSPLIGQEANPYDDEFANHWPLTGAHDWCGEFRSKDAGDPHYDDYEEDE